MIQRPNCRMCFSLMLALFAIACMVAQPASAQVHAAPRIALSIGAVIGRIDRAFRRGVLEGLDDASLTVRQSCGPDGILARSRSTGAATLWVAVVLGIFLVIYYVRD